MTAKPDSRRLDWTLSTTPTRRAVRVFVVFFVVPVALLCTCLLSLWLVITIARGPRAPERSFTAMDFLPPDSVYPPDYAVLETPRWAGLDPSVGIGDDDDAYARYGAVGEEFGDMVIWVFYQAHWNTARDYYQHWLAFLSGYQPVSQIDFQSDRAQEWKLVCQDWSAERILLFCAYVARYDEFVINLRAGVGPDHLSLAEFESLLRAIDQRAIELLGTTPAPIP